MKLVLFSGPQCHLCEVAQDVIQHVGTPIELEVRNIRDNPEHYHRYALRIPVLYRTDNQQELGWPFDANQVEQFIQ